MNRKQWLIVGGVVAAGALAAVAQQQQQLMFWPVRGTREMVAAANNQEVEAGFRILSQGGNAIDAGVAATLAAAVTEQARFGLGGEMPLIVKMAGKKPMVVAGVGVAPKKATAELYSKRPAEPWERDGQKPPIPGQGMMAAITPGVFDGLMLALETYGTMSFAQVSAPAMEYAGQGFPIGEEFVSFIRGNQRLIELWPASKDLFLPGGQIPKRGEVFKVSPLAKTFEELARAEKKARGNRAKKIRAVRDYWARGPLAKRMAAASEASGGLITYDDLAGFKAEIEEPKTTTYRGYTIVKPGFWTQGPVMIEALNMLESYDLKKMGHNSPEYLHTVLEAVKLAFADRDRHYGDPKFSKIPEATLLSKEYAAERRKLIDPARASMESRPGKLDPNGVAMPSGGGSSAGVQDTTCVNVVDRWGNVYNATPSGAWLPSVIAGDTGVPFSSRAQSFVMDAGHPNQIAPGKRPRVTLSPTLVLNPDGTPFLAMSTPGGDNQDQAMLQVLLNIIEFGMIPQEAVEAPRVQTEHFYASFAFHEFTPGKVNVEQRMPREVIEQLKSLGHQVDVRGAWSNASAPTVILMRPGGVLDGGADPRRGRYIFGR
ncbi:MAG: gamma-glutamyltransferase family protein [Bryobacterales bacterium]|nr:gamma-glutamyltransferase family protein [Bryobacterales bacterium]